MAALAWETEKSRRPLIRAPVMIAMDTLIFYFEIEDLFNP